MSIVLTGCNGFRNRGVEALITPSVAELRSRLPMEPITLLSGSPKFDEARDIVGLTIVRDPYIGRVNSLSVRRRAARWSPRFFPAEAKAFEVIKNSRIVIASGGDNFSSDYGDIRMHLEPLVIAQSFGISTVMLAQSIGPFRRDDQKEQFLKVARKANLITVRESRSYDYATRELQLDEKCVFLTADPAFLLEPTAPGRITQFRHRYGLIDNAPTVAIAMSRGISSFGGLESSSESATKVHLSVLVEIVRSVLDDLDAQVLLVPHVQETSPTNNDLYFAESIVDQVDDHRVRVAWGDHSAADMKGLIKSCDLVIAERMHAAIAGISTATPTMVVRYSVKADGIVGDLLGSDAASKGAIISFESYLQNGVAKACLEKAWRHRGELRSDLEAKLESVNKLSAENYDMITKVFHSEKLEKTGAL